MRPGILFYILLFISPLLHATDIYVSGRGNDFNDGSSQAPKATMAAALRQVREMRRLAGSAPYVVHNDNSHPETYRILIEAGTYPLTEPLRLRPEDSGTAAAPLVIEGIGEVVMSGGMELQGWKKAGKLWTTRVPDFNGRPVEFRQLWINGRKAVRARDAGDFEQMHRIVSVDNREEVIWVPAAAVRKIEKSPYPEMVLHQMWAISILRIKNIEIKGDSAALRFHQPESALQFSRPWPRPMIAPGRNSAFYLTNARELLDQPGEWYFDIRSRELWYYPLPGEKIQTAVVPVIDQLVVVEGTLDRPVQHVVFKNIRFSHAAWNRPSTHGHVPLQAGMHLTEAYRLRPQMIRPDNNHKLDNQAWLGRSASAVTVRNAQDIKFVECGFTHNGHTGLDYETGTLGGSVSGCIFEDLGGNGISVGSFSPSSHETHLPYLPADRRELSSGLQIHDNLITGVANEDWGTVGILAGYVNHTTIAHNEISEVSYSGISVGWGWNQTVNTMHNNQVIANHIHHYGKQMYDVAGIYTLGAQPKTEIRRNYIHSIYAPGFVHDPNHWFYLYTDEGSAFMTVADNHVPAPKFLQNANGPNNIWKNNHPFVHDSVRLQAGIRRELHPVPGVSDKNKENSQKKPNSAYLAKQGMDRPGSENRLPQGQDLQGSENRLPQGMDRLEPETRTGIVPDYFVLEFVGEQPDIAQLKQLAFQNGVVEPQFFRFKKSWVMYAISNRKQPFYELVKSTFPGKEIRLYETPLYNFNRKHHCGEAGCITEWDHHVFTIGLEEDPAKQEQYMKYHENQWKEWPEVSEGFCRARFQQLQVFRNGSQLMLIISIPKGENLDELNQLTTRDNPRVDEWNAIMKTLQKQVEKSY